MKQTTRIFIYLLIFGALALSAVGVAFGREIAQSDFFNSPKDEIEFTGVLETVDGDYWTVDGKTFLVPPSAEIDGTLSIGQLVRVHVIVNADGSLTLREVEPVSEQELENDNINDNMNDDNINDNMDDDNLNDNMDDDNLNDNMDDDNANDNSGDEWEDDNSNSNDNDDDDWEDDNSNSNDNDDDDWEDDNSNSNDNDDDDDNDNDDDDDDDDNDNDDGGDEKDPGDD